MLTMFPPRHLNPPARLCQALASTILAALLVAHVASASNKQGTDPASSNIAERDVPSMSELDPSLSHGLDMGEIAAEAAKAPNPLPDWDIVFEERTDFQTIRILRSPSKSLEPDMCLILDDVIQLCERFDPHYHEMMVHFPAMYLNKLERVLIIGGGDGMVMTEALKHPTVQEVVHLEIDRRVPEMAEEYFGVKTFLDGSNERVEWIIGDAFVTLDKLIAQKQTFDLIAIDISEAPSSFKLVTDPFLERIRKVMAPQSVVSKNDEYQKLFDRNFFAMLEAQYEVPVIGVQTLTFGSNFPLIVPSFKFWNPHALGLSFYEPDKHASLIRSVNQKLGLDSKYYNIPERDLFADIPGFSERVPYELVGDTVMFKEINHLRKPLCHHVLSEIEDFELNRLPIINETLTQAMAAVAQEPFRQDVIDDGDYTLGFAVAPHIRITVTADKATQYAALDILDCTMSEQMDLVLDLFQARFHAHSIKSIVVERGL
eukprot:m.42638 g.42638  ORF g.42638 m.42638 type:complete len:486 (-) comp10721_c0_seq1:599-2056(-)